MYVVFLCLALNKSPVAVWARKLIFLPFVLYSVHHLLKHQDPFVISDHLSTMNFYLPTVHVQIYYAIICEDLLSC